MCIRDSTDSLQGESGLGGDPANVRARAKHVVAPTVEGHNRGAKIERGLQLLGNDAAEEAAADREVRVLHGLAGRIREALRHKVGPAAHRAVGLFVSHALSEAVADGDVSNGSRLLGFGLRGELVHGSTVRF